MNFYSKCSFLNVLKQLYKLLYLSVILFLILQFLCGEKLCDIIVLRGHIVAQLFEALRYKLEGWGGDS